MSLPLNSTNSALSPPPTSSPRNSQLQLEHVVTEVRETVSGSVLKQEQRPSSRWRRWLRVFVHHMKKHTGLGAICAVAYFDPGNWSVDLQAGSEYGYKLLFVVLLAGVMAVVFQAMACRLGCVTGLDLATHCRLLLYNRPKYPRLCRWLLLYPLYVLCEIAIISTDLAELLGTATALTLLFPKLPLWAGVLITASDVLVVLAFSDPTQGRPQRLFELMIAILVLAVFVSLIVVIVEVNPDWGDTFFGFVPSNTIIKPGALYTSIGIIGATVMPHGLFLGSSLATQDRVSTFPSNERAGESRNISLDSLASANSDKSQHVTVAAPDKIKEMVSTLRSWRPVGTDRYSKPMPDENLGHAGWENNSHSFVLAHLRHGIVDIVFSLLGFAVVINSLILIIASAVFYYGPEVTDGSDPADLFQAFNLISQRVGRASAILFALALLCAGESAGITATLAGQIVSEGFLRWSVSPVLRRALTRLIGLIPSMLVAAILGRSGLNTLLVASQVILSFVLPFVSFPLVWITSSKKLMSVKRNPAEGAVTNDSSSTPEGTQSDVEAAKEDMVDYSNGMCVMILGYAIFFVVLLANVYVIVTLGMGES